MLHFPQNAFTDSERFVSLTLSVYGHCGLIVVGRLELALLIN